MAKKAYIDKIDVPKKKIFDRINRNEFGEKKKQLFRIAEVINQALLERDGSNKELIAIYNAVCRGLYAKQLMQNPIDGFFKLEMRYCRCLGKVRWAIVERAREIIKTDIYKGEKHI